MSNYVRFFIYRHTHGLAFIVSLNHVVSVVYSKFAENQRIDAYKTGIVCANLAFLVVRSCNA